MSLIGTHPKYSNARIEEIIKIREGKTTNNVMAKKNEHVKRLEYKPNNFDELTKYEKAGFISVAIILEASLALGFIFGLIALVKR